MKQLLFFSIITVLFIPVLSKSQDSAFTLKGKLLQPSSMKSLTLFYPLMHMDSIQIQADGSFHIQLIFLKQEKCKLAQENHP